MKMSDYIPMLNDPYCIDESLLPLSRFTWDEALRQHRWGFCIVPNEEQRINIMLMASKLEQIASALYPKQPVFKIHSWLRARPYNVLIGGAKESAHIDGMAVDFSIEGAECYVIAQLIKPHLERLDIRMEKLPDTAGWLHLDLRKPINGVRFFIP